MKKFPVKPTVASGVRSGQKEEEGASQQTRCRKLRNRFQADEDFNTSVDKFVEIASMRRANCSFFKRVERFALFQGNGASQRQNEMQRKADSALERLRCGRFSKHARSSVPLRRAIEVNLDHLVGFGDFVLAAEGFPAVRDDLNERMSERSPWNMREPFPIAFDVELEMLVLAERAFFHVFHVNAGVLDRHVVRTTGNFNRHAGHGRIFERSRGGPVFLGGGSVLRRGRWVLLRRGILSASAGQRQCAEADQSSENEKTEETHGELRPSSTEGRLGSSGTWLRFGCASRATRCYRARREPQLAARFD